MSSIPTLPGITSQMVQTSRLQMHALFSGPESGEPVLFIHGNAASSTFWEEIMLNLPPGFRGIAPDLRGYGDTEDLLIDATRGPGDWVDDLLALKRALNVESYHLAVHSLSGIVAYALVVADGANIRSVTLVDPCSPYGFGGTKDLEGTPTPEFAGSGGGTVNPEFVRLMAEGDRSTDNPQASPRVVMNSFYWKPPFRAEREEELLSSMLSEKTGPQKYPGDFTASSVWPNVAPGVYGPINAISGKHVQGLADKFIAAQPKPPILWVRGDSDQIVSDTSFFDICYLGQLGLVPGWPGAETHRPQPMVSQTRAVLERYAGEGGSFREVVIEDAGHTPYIEKPEEFMQHFGSFLKDNQAP